MSEDSPIALLYDTNGVNASIFPAGFLRVSDEPRQIFYDPYDSAIDTANRWNAPTNSGGGVAASVSAGVMTLGSGTTANGYSYLQSQPSFVPVVPGWLGLSFTISIEFAVGNNATRFWGSGTSPGSPTAAVPITDGFGFEIDINGKLNAVVYASGVRTVVQDLSSATGNNTQPADANSHRYVIYYRTDKIYWYIDSLAVPVATSNFQGPNIQTLPVKLTAVAHTSGPASSRVITCSGVAVWDTGKNQTQLSDGTYAWRKVTVNATGSLNTSPSLPSAQIWKSASYTTTQTGTGIWTPASGKKIAITSITIGSFGTTAARLILWFGATADTTYTAGTDQLVTAASFAPSATAKPGMVFTPAIPILCATADYLLRITTDAALSVDLAVYGYEF